MKKSMVSSLSASFKKAAMPADVEEAKLRNRETLEILKDKYLEDVAKGKADGIRNSKELVEVMKMEMLLLGEATERTENNSPEEEVRINKITQYLDVNNENVSDILAGLMDELNEANDALDQSHVKKDTKEDSSVTDIDSSVLDELAQQAMDDYMNKEDEE
ncbi:gp1.9 [Bacillus phage SPO1]|uniref:Gp1.9 n=1 Tax=Bacillus phage SP01 TaxID=2884427 RepID=B6V2Y9_BPSP1|nr:gp1.9 [Bacillus phage SPO1]ACI90957.1 gp1.9 [Bacillus phage SPO1]